MAEAAVEDSATNRFFCHKCSIEITRVLEDYTCPTCRGGFIEELDSTNTSSDEPIDVHSDDEMDEFFSDVHNPFGQYFFGRDGSRGNQDRDSRNDDETVEGDGPGRRVIALIISLLSSNRARLNNNSFQNQYGRNEALIYSTFQIIEDFYSLLGLEQTREGNIFGRYNSIEHRIPDFIVNLTEVGWGPVGPGGRGNEPVVLDCFSLSLYYKFAVNHGLIRDFTYFWNNGRFLEGEQFFLGNPFDYARYRAAIDAIATHVLNEVDGIGPPPLDKEKIREIPVTVIKQEQVDSSLQCSVCWDDFKVGETVRKLECEHFYHESCIVPWLELHGTCPICRKSLLGDEEDKTSANAGTNRNRSNLAAVFHAVHNRTPSNMRSAPSSSANSTTTQNTNSSNGRQPPPSSDFPMDLEYDES